MELDQIRMVCGGLLVTFVATFAKKRRKHVKELLHYLFSLLDNAIRYWCSQRRLKWIKQLRCSQGDEHRAATSLGSPCTHVCRWIPSLYGTERSSNPSSLLPFSLFDKCTYFCNCGPSWFGWKGCLPSSFSVEIITPSIELKSIKKVKPNNEQMQLWQIWNDVKQIFKFK